MDKRIFLSFCFLLFEINLIACDICGCFMGITPYDNQSSISFLHRYRSYSGYRVYHQQPYYFPDGSFKTTNPASVFHGNGDTTKLSSYSAKDFEVYKVYELRLKYFIHHRTELNAYIPVNSNSSLNNGIKSSVTGIGDISIFGAYHLIKKVDYQVYQQRLILGAGVKIPAGKNSVKGADDDRLPLLLQTGTGSLDYFTYINYIGSYKKFGFGLNAIYKLNTANNFGERVSNSSSGYFDVFYKLKVKDLIVISSLKSYYEYTKGVITKGKLEENTGMNVLLVGPGLDTYYKNIGVNLAFQFKVREQCSAYNLGSAGRLVLGVNYNFNQKKYLIKSKKDESN
ncbi:MAG: hypothetical protein ACJ76F_04280 [Bacteroidia bacterium]